MDGRLVAVYEEYDCTEEESWAVWEPCDSRAKVGNKKYLEVLCQFWGELAID
jgi:hypothetical protein